MSMFGNERTLIYAAVELMPGKSWPDVQSEMPSLVILLIRPRGITHGLLW